MLFCLLSAPPSTLTPTPKASLHLSGPSQRSVWDQSPSVTPIPLDACRTKIKVPEELMRDQWTFSSTKIPLVHFSYRASHPPLQFMSSSMVRSFHERMHSTFAKFTRHRECPGRAWTRVSPPNMSLGFSTGFHRRQGGWGCPPTLIGTHVMDRSVIAHV